MDSQIRLSKSVIGIEEINLVKKVLEEEYLGMGKYVQQFEQMLSDFLGRDTVCVNTGTSAIHLALQAIDIGPGDEVLVQSLTYLATFQAISATGAKPIPCEVIELTLTIDLADAEKMITSRTKAIIPVHYAGNPGELEEVYRFAKKFNLRVIEDAAHAFGSLYKGKVIGSFGDIVCFSFDGIKNITSGEGGAVVSGDAQVLNRIRDLRLLGIEKDTAKRFANQRSWDFDVKEQGWRYHMSNIFAAIGIEQLKKFTYLSKKRKELAKLYQQKFSEHKDIKILKHDYELITPHIFVIMLKNKELIKKELDINGVQTGIHYKPNHMLTYYSCLRDESLEVTERIFNELLTIPLHPDIKQPEIDFIANIIIQNTILT